MARRKHPDPSTLLPRDSVDRIVDGWHAARGDLDVTPVAVVARLGRLRTIIEREMEAVFSTHGIGGAGFAALAAIARLDDGRGVSQVVLMGELRLTSGTISVRIDRLVTDGLAERVPDPDDRRGTRVLLTDRGREVFETVAPAHLDNERRLLAALTPQEQSTLAALLRKLLVDLEEAPAADDAASRHLGAALASAHATVSMRRAVGLPDAPGLLVRSVQPGGVAAQAGVVAGDVVVQIDDHKVCSLVDVATALAKASKPGSRSLTVLRGGRSATLHLPSTTQTGG